MAATSVTFCVYDNPDSVGGPYIWAIDFAVGLFSAKFKIAILVFCPGGGAASRIMDECVLRGIQCRCCDTDQMTFLEEQVEWILDQWKLSPTQVFIANSVLPALFACRWIRDAGAKSVMVVHSNPERERFYPDAFQKFVSSEAKWRVDSVVCVSDYIAKQVVGVAPAEVNVTTIPCGTKLSSIRASRQSNSISLIYCGRLVQEAKRIREVTEALLSVTVKLPEVTASICGEGPEREWLVQRISGQDKVRYLGAIAPKDIQMIMSQHHAIVFLSDYEGLSMALVEGMSCGLVPICLDEPSGAREVIRQGVNGFIVKDGEADFLQAVQSLCDRDVWLGMSEEARATVEARYSHPVVFEKWRALLNDLAVGAVPDPGKVPVRVSLSTVRGAGSFAGYPANRPTRVDLLQSRSMEIWRQLRVRLRPRRRFRAIVARMTRSKRPSA